MEAIKIKRVYDAPQESDGYRIFVDRLWPRGIKKEELQYDLWAKDLAPSAELRKWYHEDIDGRWEEFAEAYQQELEQTDGAQEIRNKIGDEKTITLLYAAKDPQHNHALVLADYLRNNLNL